MSTTTDKLRENIQEIAKLNMEGVSLDTIAKKYGCSRFLVIRVMRQELPAEFWANKAMKKAEQGKKRELKEVV